MMNDTIPKASETDTKCDSRLKKPLEPSSADLSLSFRRRENKFAQNRQDKNEYFDNQLNPNIIELFRKPPPLHEQFNNILKRQLELVYQNSEDWKQVARQTQAELADLLALSEKDEVKSNSPKVAQSAIRHTQTTPAQDNHTDTLATQDDRHDELQKDVLHMIETTTTPTGERYQTREYRKDDGKKENAEEFLLRVYAKFKKSVKNSTDIPFPLQGIYQDQLKKIDPELLAALNQLTKIKTASMVLPKEARNDRKISELKINLNIDKKTIGMISSRIRKFAT